MTTPLEGLRVLDFTRVLSGPHCTRMLADLGAEVIKVEPPAGDITRFAAPRRNSMPTYFAQQNTGKRSLSINLSDPAGTEVVLALADLSDIVVENFRPGVMARLGLDYDTLAARNPGLVYVSISGYGATGPWTDRRAYAPVVQAEVGFTKSQGDHGGGGVYRNDRHSHADVYTSLEAVSGVLAAVIQRHRTGKGQWVDVSMAQTMLCVNEHTHDDLWTDEVDPRWIRSFGNEHQPIVTVANGDQVIIAGHPAQNGTFELYLQAIGKPELADDPRFVDAATRQEHLDDLVEYVRTFALTMADPVVLEERFAACGLAVGAIRSVVDVCDSEWARERNAIVEIDDRKGGTFRIPNAPWVFSDAPEVGVHGTPRYRGEDNAAVLREVLGFDDDRIAALTEAGVLSAHRPRS